MIPPSEMILHRARRAGEVLDKRPAVNRVVETPGEDDMKAVGLLPDRVAR